MSFIQTDLGLYLQFNKKTFKIKVKDMKEKVNTKTIEEKTVTYVAVDGTEFITSNECLSYEKSAKGMLLAKYKDILIKTVVEDMIFGFGSDDYNIDVVNVRDEKDIDMIMQLAFLFNPDYAHEGCLSAAKWREECKRAMEGKEPLFIGRGYDKNEFWIMHPVSWYIELIKEACIPDKKEE